jgi:hypothetical protein
MPKTGIFGARELKLALWVERLRCPEVTQFRGNDDEQDVLLIFDPDNTGNFNAYVAAKVAGKSKAR